MTLPAGSVLLAVAIGASALAGAGVAAADPAPAPAPAGAAPANTISANGTYKVGVDIAPGSYESAGPAADGDACYWKRLAGDKIVDNALTKKPQVITIDAADTAFLTRDCAQWHPADCSQVSCPPPGGTPPPAGVGALLSILGPQINRNASSGQPPAASAPPSAPAPAAPGN